MRFARSSLLVTTLALAAAAITLSACGAAKQAQNAVDPVAQAAQVTQRSGTAEIAFDGQVVSAGTTVPIKGEGVIDTRDGSRGRLSVHSMVNGKQVTLDEILAEKALYMGGEALRHDLPSGKQWAKIDLRKVAAKAGVDISSFDAGGSSASEMLRYLRGAGSVRKLAGEQVAGARTTHYHAVVDLAKLAGQRGDNDFAAKLRAQVKGPMTLDVWIDAAHRVRQEKVAYAMATNGQNCARRFHHAIHAFWRPDEARHAAQGRRAGRH